MIPYINFNKKYFLIKFLIMPLAVNLKEVQYFIFISTLITIVTIYEEKKAKISVVLYLLNPFLLYVYYSSKKGIKNKLGRKKNNDRFNLIAMAQYIFSFLGNLAVNHHQDLSLVLFSGSKICYICLCVMESLQWGLTKHELT